MQRKFHSIGRPVPGWPSETLGRDVTILHASVYDKLISVNSVQLHMAVFASTILPCDVVVGKSASLQQLDVSSYVESRSKCLCLHSGLVVFILGFKILKIVIRGFCFITGRHYNPLEHLWLF